MPFGFSGENRSSMGSNPYSSRIPESGTVIPVFLIYRELRRAQIGQIYTPSLDSQVKYEIVLARFALGLGLWCHLDAFVCQHATRLARNFAIRATKRSFCDVEVRVDATE